MNRFNRLNEEELLKVKQAGYDVDINEEYGEDDYKRCINVIGEYIMSHSKNEIPRIENEFINIVRKIG